MNADQIPKIRAHIAELEALLRQLHAGESDLAAKLKVERVEQSLTLFRDMLNDLAERDRK